MPRTQGKETQCFRAPITQRASAAQAGGRAVAGSNPVSPIRYGSVTPDARMFAKAASPQNRTRMERRQLFEAPNRVRAPRRAEHLGCSFRTGPRFAAQAISRPPGWRPGAGRTSAASADRLGCFCVERWRGMVSRSNDPAPVYGLSSESEVLTGLLEDVEHGAQRPSSGASQA